MTATGAMHGADPNQLDELAVRFRTTADELTRIHATIRVQLQRVPWKGVNAECFRRDWDGPHRTRIRNIANALTSQATTLNRNAADQRKASSGSNTGGRTWEDLFRVLTPGLTLIAVGPIAKGIGTFTDAAQFFAQNRYVTGRYTKAWESVIRWSDGFGVPGELMEFKQSPVFQFLNRNENAISSIGDAANMIGIGVTAISVGQSLSQGHYFDAGAAIANETGDQLKSKGISTGDPIAYLAGVNVAIWTDVVSEARQVDWSAEGMQYIAAASWDDWKDSFSEAGKKLLTKLPGFFL